MTGAFRRGTLAAVLLLAACGDRDPVALAPDDAFVPATALAAIDCVVVVRGATTCRPAPPGTGAARGLVFGGQNQHLRLAAGTSTYDPGTEVFEVDVTVQNLLAEAIGTLDDGTTPDPDGIRVFFHQDPFVTDGEGTVEVIDPDGTGFFTAANQPYHAYHQVLRTDEVSEARTWRFSVPGTVNAFGFRVLVQTEIQFKLVINEVLANPGGTITDVNGEWFELYNAGTLPVQLQDLVIADSAASGRRPYHLIASSVVVPPGGYAVLGNNSDTSLNGGVALDYSYGGALSLANSLDAIKIARVFGGDTLTLDRTQYSSAAVSTQDGISRELKNPALDNSNMDGSNWAAALVTAVYGPGGRGTPGAQNSTYTP